MAVQERGTFYLAQTDGVAALQRAEKMVKYLADKCKGPQFINTIKGRRYPKFEWWTSVGACLGLFPVEESCERLDRPDEVAYQVIVTVRRSGDIILRGSAMCSDAESTWSSRDEYAIRSMAVTRATGKVYRIAFSFLAVMVGLEATLAEEISENQPKLKQPRDPQWTGLIKEIAEVIRSSLSTDVERYRCGEEIKKASDMAILVKIRDQCRKVLQIRKRQAEEASADPTFDQVANEG